MVISGIDQLQIFIAIQFLAQANGCQIGSSTRNMVIKDFIPFRAVKIRNGIGRSVGLNKGKFICVPATCKRIYLIFDIKKPDA